MSVPTLTFLIPTFNRADLVLRAIRSVLQSTRPGAAVFEVIVVDDGSDDGTRERLSAVINSDQIVYVGLASNRGVAAARNAGIAIARGEWIVLLDSDNELLPNAIERLQTALEMLPPSVGVFWGNCIERNGRATTSHGVSGVVPGRHLVEGRYPGEHFSVVRTTLARKHMFAELGTRNECAACFWFPIALESELYLSSDVFQLYETAGDDRITSVASRLQRAPELVRCFEETLLRFGDMLQSCTPAVYWGLRGRIALYRAVAGEWHQSVIAALAATRGFRYQPSNIGVLLLCLAGPWCARAAIRRRSP
jgi:glycosyltransferase involved in cell wall biosynthesis